MNWKQTILATTLAAMTIGGPMTAQTPADFIRPAVATSDQTAVVMTPVAHYYRKHYYNARTRRGYYGPTYRVRSRRKSAAIVGGSALGGAAIGALAGGGKGAAIGAIAGGGAGLVYDRATHKKRVY